MAPLLTLLARLKSRSTMRGKAPALSPLLVLTDVARGYDLDRQITRWHKNRDLTAVFIERTFGRAVQDIPWTTSPRLASCTPQQARAARIDGVHWPQKQLGRRRVSQTKGLIETTSAHNGLAIAKAARHGFAAILVSTAFASNSPSATRPLGAIRIAKLQRAFPRARIYALGGISLATAKQLMGTQICGVALVSYAEGEAIRPKTAGPKQA